MLELTSLSLGAISKSVGQPSPWALRACSELDAPGVEGCIMDSVDSCVISTRDTGLAGLEGTTPRTERCVLTWLCFLLATWAWIGHSRLGFHDDSLPQLSAAVVRDDAASQHAFLKHILNICLGLQEIFGIKEGEKLYQFSGTCPGLALKVPYASGQTGMTDHPRGRALNLASVDLWALGVSIHKSLEFIHSILCI